jgi:hypothetical protein
MATTNSTQFANGDDALRLVNKQAVDMATAEEQCERGYAHLGWLLLEVAEMQYWRIHHGTFREYLGIVATASKKTVPQLHRYFLTVRDLSDTFSREQLETIGITKAMQLRQAKDYAIILPAVVVNAALDPTVTAKDLKKLISVTLKMPSDDPGDWLDCEMEFIVDAEQRALIAQAIDVAMRTEPLTKTKISQSAQRLDIMVKFCQEFLGAHSGDGQ